MFRLKGAAFVIGVIGATAALCSGCFAFDWDYAGGGGAMASSNTGGSGGGGGTIHCDTPGDCGQADPCSVAACRDHRCVSTPAPVDTSCGEGSVCDADGACVTGGSLDSVVGFAAPSAADAGPQVSAVALDTNGDFYLTVVGRGTLDDDYLIKAGPSEWSLLRLDSHLAVKAEVDFGSATVSSVAAANGVVFVGGTFAAGDVIATCDAPMDTSGGFVAKFRGTTCEHLDTFGPGTGDGSARVTGVAATSDGEVVVIGDFSEAFSVNGSAKTTAAGHTQVFVTRRTSAGQSSFLAFYGDEGFTTQAKSALNIAIAPNDEVLVSGTYLGLVTFDHQLPVAKVSPSVFLARLRSDGGTRWSTTLGTNVATFGRSIAVDPSGNVAIAGQSTGTVAFGSGRTGKAGPFVGVFDSNGDSVWGKVYSPITSGTQPVTFADLAFDPHGDLALAGGLSGSIDLGVGKMTSTPQSGPTGSPVDALVFKVDPTGTTLWASNYGDGSLQEGTAIAETQDSETIFTGVFDGSIAFGTQTILGTPGGFLLTLGP